MKLHWCLALAAILSSSSVAVAKKGAKLPCPAAVKATTDKAFPGNTGATCKAEREDGKDIIEVKLTRKEGGQVELDVAPDGALLQIEEVVAVAELPAPVTKAFTAKYPKAKPERAEKQTITGKGVFFELAFTTDKGRKEATFAADGAFVEEE
jgi:hypothetical protein